MEPEEDVASLQQPKRSKPTNRSLPQELITDILVRLPVKYLLQFKCVSKEWFNLISSPEFVKTHLSFSAKDSTRHRLMLTLEKSCHILKHCPVSSLFNEFATESFALDHPLKALAVHFVGSLNGLVCLRIGFEALVLWNPSTRKFKQVLHLMPPTYEYWYRFGFGYDEVHDDYKVVVMLSTRSDYSVDARIYSLKRDHLRILNDFQDGVIYPDSSKCVNGRLYWATSSFRDGWGIVSIDLADEKWRQVEQPCHEEGDYNLKIGVLGNDICVLCNYKRVCWITRFDIWVMKENGVKESCTKLHTINYPFHNDNCGPSPPLFMSNKGEILFVFRFTLAIYNPEDDSIRYPEVTNVDGRLKAEHYIESLVCPILQNEPTAQN